MQPVTLAPRQMGRQARAKFEGEPMAGGQAVDTGKLKAAGSAYAQEGAQLGDIAAGIESGVSERQIGNAWRDSAQPYIDAIDRYRDLMSRYAELTSELGDKLSSAAESYERGEEVTRDSIAGKA